MSSYGKDCEPINYSDLNQQLSVADRLASPCDLLKQCLARRIPLLLETFVLLRSDKLSWFYVLSLAVYVCSLSLFVHESNRGKDSCSELSPSIIGGTTQAPKLVPSYSPPLGSSSLLPLFLFCQQRASLVKWPVRLTRPKRVYVYPNIQKRGLSIEKCESTRQPHNPS